MAARKLLSAALVLVSSLGNVFADGNEMLTPLGPTSIEKLATSGGMTEGPTVLPDGSVVFSDLQLENIYRWSEADGLSIYIEQTRRANGLMVSEDGWIYACETRKGEATLARFNIETKEREVFAKGYQGKPFNRVNDLVIDREGGVYFSDISGGGQGMPQETAAVYYVSHDKKVTRLIANLGAPNGVLLSRDETYLFVSPMREGRIMRYPIIEPGKIGEGEEFYNFGDGKERAPGGDGLAMDVNGNLYLAQFAGKSLHVVSPEGERLGIIPFEDKTTNCSFGGPDGRTLYVTSGDSLFALRMLVPGHVFPGRRE